MVRSYDRASQLGQTAAACPQTQRSETMRDDRLRAYLPRRTDRRTILKGAGATLTLAAATPFFRTGAGAATLRQTPTTTDISGTNLSILLWSHFVPLHDVWFDQFVAEWGEANGVTTQVDHVNTADVPAAIAAEITAGQGHDIVEHIASLAQYEKSVLDMTDVVQELNNRHGEQLPMAMRNSYNPTTNVYFGLCHGFAPDPGNYRRSLWEKVEMADGPTSWDDLLAGGTKIKQDQGVQMGIGMSNEQDSRMAAQTLLWAYGAAIQDENESVVINQPETGADIFFRTPLLGRAGEEGALAHGHAVFISMIPNHAQYPDTAKEFLFHLVGNYAAACEQSELYNFPAWPSTVPDLETWLDNDPYGSQPADKLALLKTANDWTTNLGHPGPANAAIGEIFALPTLPNMMARAATGQQSPEDSVAEAEITAIFDKWRAEGLMGGGT